jgi:DNA-binding transcriptional MocR family regulator
VTWPTYLGALQAFNAYEPNYDRLEPMGNREPGDFVWQARDGGAVKFAYVSPDFANPTGETMTQAERERVLDLAEALDIAVIEDGAYQALRYDGEAIPPMLALEIARKGDIEKCRTIYCGTFSKTLSPGLRVGWVCAAQDIVSRLVILKQAGDLHSARRSTRRRSTMSARGNVRRAGEDEPESLWRAARPHAGGAGTRNAGKASAGAGRKAACSSG